LVRRGAKLVEAKITKSIDETLKVLKDWAEKNRLKVNIVDRLRIKRFEIPRLNIIYYPNMRPEKIYIDCYDEECIIERIDKPSVAYVTRVGEVTIAVFKG
jgi:hypothetical protein